MLSLAHTLTRTLCAPALAMAFENAHAIANSDSESLRIGRARKEGIVCTRTMAAPNRFVF